MRHLNNFKKFFEDLAVNISDNPAIKIAKQSYNTTQENLTEYKAKKDQLTKIYIAINPEGGLLYDDTLIQKEVDKLLGKKDISSGKDRNPFLSDLVVLLDLQRRIEKLQKSNSDDKLTLDDLKNDVSTEDNPDSKEQTSNKIDEINNRMSLNKADISKLNTEYIKSKKAHDDEMSKLNKDLQASVKKILDQPKK